MTEPEVRLWLPRATAQLVDTHSRDGSGSHPGLQLDKFSNPYLFQPDSNESGKTVPSGQKHQKDLLRRVASASGDNPLLQRLRARRCAMLTGLSALSWSATTAGALTLHLSRASALENAGLCLHPLYGFVYLPGSGLKGMVRAYAETVWLKAEGDRGQSEEPIDRVFGRAPKGKAEGWAGSVIFHDAWPEAWPRLIVDIVNNHHKAYYQGKDAPGDWENPELSYLLAVPPGVAFSFALSPRPPGDAAAVADLAMAKGWLNGALCHLGAGAKTAAGYGSFRLAGQQPPSPAQVVKDDDKWAEWSGTLELVTPAFLAGAGRQQAADCDLRPATLRGLLRCWWRTMHAAYLEADELRKLEAAVWGSTAAGSAVALTVAPRVRTNPVAWRGKRGGLAYASYGMEENQRNYTPEGASWDVRMVARAARFPAGTKAHEKHLLIPPLLIMEQAHAALWLLCHFGGVGSKARNGFGSLKNIDGFSIETCRAAAQSFRNECGATQDCDLLETPAIERMLPFSDLQIEGTAWQVIDRVGTALQTFAKSLPEKISRECLGLPRRVSISRGNEIWVGKDHPKRGNRELKDMRDAAPVQCHLAKSVDDALILRVAAFPSPYLPNLDRCSRTYWAIYQPNSAPHRKKNIAPRVTFRKRRRGRKQDNR